MAIIPKGQEPANIKKRLDTLFPKLNEAYPDKVIRSLARDHKKWAETVTELYRAYTYQRSVVVGQDKSRLYSICPYCSKSKT